MEKNNEVRKCGKTKKFNLVDRGKKMLKLIELFAGIGTQYKAFSKYIDTEVVGISEIDERPIKNI